LQRLWKKGLIKFALDCHGENVSGNICIMVVSGKGGER
jgi:hypothetical protein